MDANAKQESERLINALLPLAEKMLRQYGEFYPFGGYIKPDGNIVEMGADDPDTEKPKSKDLIYILRTSLQDLARNHKVRAAAIIFDVAVALPVSDRKGDAIQICVDHVGGYSAEVFFPYGLVDDEIVYGETFAQEGKHEIFA
jgi:hypothetical protein